VGKTLKCCYLNFYLRCVTNSQDETKTKNRCVRDWNMEWIQIHLTWSGSVGVKGRPFHDSQVPIWNSQFGSCKIQIVLNIWIKVWGSNLVQIGFYSDHWGNVLNFVLNWWHYVNIISIILCVWRVYTQSIVLEFHFSCLDLKTHPRSTRHCKH